MPVNNPAQKKKKGLSKNSVIALCAVACVVVIGLFITVERSLVKSISKNNTIISKKQTAEKQLNTNLANLPQLETAYKSIADLQGKINNSLPETPDFPGVVATMEVIAGTSGVILDSVSPTSSSTTLSAQAAVPATAASPSAAVSSINGTGTTTTGTADVPQQPMPTEVTMQVTGTYANFMQFLSKLQLSSRPMKISSITVTGVTDEVEASVVVTTYYFKPEVLKEKTEAVQ